MERLTGVKHLRRNAKILVQPDKFRCMSKLPIKKKIKKNRLEGLAKSRLKRSSFIHENKKQTRQFQDRLPQNTLPIYPPDMSELWVMDMTDIKVHTTVPSLSGGYTQDGTVKQSLTLTMTAERYPREVWIHAFTDGPEANAVTNRGAGILIHFPGGQKASTGLAVGKHCSKIRTETESLMQAASIVQASDPDCKQVVSPCDALSVLQTYQNYMLPSLAKDLQQVAVTQRAVPQCIPAHCGISGNEQAGILAKEYSMTTISASAKRTLPSDRSRCQGHRGMTVT